MTSLRVFTLRTQPSDLLTGWMLTSLNLGRDFWSALECNKELSELALHDTLSHLDVSGLLSCRWPYLTTLTICHDLDHYTHSANVKTILDFVQAHQRLTSLSIPFWMRELTPGAPLSADTLIDLPNLSNLWIPSNVLHIFASASVTVLKIPEAGWDDDLNVIRSANGYSQLKSLQFCAQGIFEAESYEDVRIHCRTLYNLIQHQFAELEELSIQHVLRTEYTGFVLVIHSFFTVVSEMTTPDTLGQYASLVSRNQKAEKDYLQDIHSFRAK